MAYVHASVVTNIFLFRSDCVSAGALMMASWVLGRQYWLCVTHWMAHFWLAPLEDSQFWNNCGWIYSSSSRGPGMIGVPCYSLEFPILQLLWSCSDSLPICAHVGQSWDNRILKPQRFIWIALHTASVFAIGPGRVSNDIRARSMSFCIRLYRPGKPWWRSRCSPWIHHSWRP